MRDMMSVLLEGALDEELNEELGYSKYDYRNKETDNSRNGHSEKTMRTSYGDMDIAIPRDRKGVYEPQLIPKYQNTVTQDMEEKIISMYAKGMTTTARNLPKRMRYYQGMIDLNILEKGDDYNHLKKSYVIFICTFDPFGLGRHIYTFENRCSEDTALTLNDGTVKIILNTKGTLDDVSPEMKRLLDYVDGKGVSDTFTRDLEEAVQSARQNEKWRLDYMTLQQEYRERFQEGKVEGIKEGKIEGLREGKIVGKIETLYEELHMTVVEIAEKLAISEEEVQKIVDAL